MEDKNRTNIQNWFSEESGYEPACVYHESELNIFLWEDDDAGNLVLFQDKKNK